MSDKFYITTPIYYVNDVPHIGHAYTSIAVDFLARYSRMCGVETRFTTGTDEHGLKIQKAAKKRNIDEQSLCDENSEIFRELTNILNLSNDDFIRTTEERHKIGASFLWNKLYENDDIYLDKYDGWYSVSDETFYNEKDLIKQKDETFKTITGGPVEWIEEESYFFRLSKYENKLLKFYRDNSDFILPKSKYNEVVSFVKSGLKDLSVSRASFDWGIKVPNNEKHIMYVWLDALTSYPNSINYLSNDNDPLSDYWSNVIHIVGKDILRHHAVYWPAFLLAAGLKLPKRIFAHGWWTNEGNKISKSLGNVIDPIELINEYGLDQIRYFLLREVPFGNDGDFAIKALNNRINADLSNDLGNLCQRSLTMIEKSYNSTIPSDKNLSVNDKALLNSIINNNLPKLDEYISKQDITSYIKTVWESISDTNKYFNDKRPWELKKTNEIEYGNVLYVTAEIIRRISILIYPVMPDTSKKILSMLSCDCTNILISDIKNDNVSGKKLQNVKQLFPRV